jgi:hypothetical protein
MLVVQPVIGSIAYPAVSEHASPKPSLEVLARVRRISSNSRHGVVLELASARAGHYIAVDGLGNDIVAAEGWGGIARYPTVWKSPLSGRSTPAPRSGAKYRSNDRRTDWLPGANSIHRPSGSATVSARGAGNC